VEEMDASGELQDILKAGGSGRDAEEEGKSLEDRLRHMTTRADVVLFMKVKLSSIQVIYILLVLGICCSNPALNHRHRPFFTMRQ
jgi:hypothetical protein